MFINNIKDIKVSFFYCNKIMARYLISNNFPLLGIEDNLYVFSNTEKLKSFFNNIPWYIKFLSGGEKKNEKRNK